MKSIYLETSALLSWLLGEEMSERVVLALEKSENILTSRLTFMEAHRALIRAEKAAFLKEADRQKLLGILEQCSKGWFFLEITSGIQQRASQNFPVEPIRTLDAIHLASALEFLKVYPDLQVMSFDERILSNLEPLGLLSVKL